MSTVVEILVIVFICLIFLGAVDRICKCVEECTKAKAYTEFAKNAKKDEKIVEKL